MADTNIFTDAGEAWVADQVIAAIAASAEGAFFIGWGSGGTTAAKGNTALTTPQGSRIEAITTNPSASVIRVAESITAGGSFTVNEAGVFTASTGVTMVCSSTFTGIPVTSGDSIAFTFDLTLT